MYQLKVKAYWLIAFIIYFATMSVLNPIPTEAKVPDSIILNSRRFADAQNSSYLPVAGRFNGDIIWEQKSILDEPMQPVHLAINGPLLIIRYPSYINVRNRETGQSVWVRQLRDNFTFDLKPEGLVTLGKSGYYELLGLNQEVIKRMSLPFLSNDTFLYFSHQKGNEMYYVYQSIPIPITYPDDKFEGPSFSFSRYNVEEQSFIWRLRRPEEIVDTLFTKDQGRFCICTANHVYLFSTTTDSDKGVKTIPFEHILSCSFDHQGNLLILGRQEKEKEISLIKFDNDYRLIWQLPIGRTVITKQPTATLPDGTAYMVAGSRLYCIKDGNITWTYQLPAKPGEAMFTLLKDGSVLLSAGVYLVHISNSGEEIKKIIVDDPITCRPIMDEEGRIYIVGVKGIRSLK